MQGIMSGPTCSLVVASSCRGCAGAVLIYRESGSSVAGRCVGKKVLGCDGKEVGSRIQSCRHWLDVDGSSLHSLPLFVLKGIGSLRHSIARLTPYVSHSLLLGVRWGNTSRGPITAKGLCAVCRTLTTSRAHTPVRTTCGRPHSSDYVGAF
jgi:hypothetical protein